MLRGQKSRKITFFWPKSQTFFWDPILEPFWQVWARAWLEIRPLRPGPGNSRTNFCSIFGNFRVFSVLKIGLFAWLEIRFYLPDLTIWLILAILGSDFGPKTVIFDPLFGPFLADFWVSKKPYRPHLFSKSGKFRQKSWKLGPKSAFFALKGENSRILASKNGPVFWQNGDFWRFWSFFWTKKFEKTHFYLKNIKIQKSFKFIIFSQIQVFGRENKCALIVHLIFINYAKMRVKSSENGQKMPFLRSEKVVGRNRASRGPFGPFWAGFFRVRRRSKVGIGCWCVCKIKKVKKWQNVTFCNFAISVTVI